MIPMTLFCAFAVAVLVLGEYLDNDRIRFTAKPLASLAFVLVGVFALMDNTSIEEFEIATLIGLFVVSGTGAVVSGLNLDGHNNFPVAGNPATAQGQAGLFIAGNNVSILGNNISNGHTAICGQRKNSPFHRGIIYSVVDLQKVERFGAQH